MITRKNKRGLSNIVATVLIVLLALAAVAIVWGFLRPTFDTAASETNLRTKCFSVDVQPVSCIWTVGSPDSVTVRVRNMRGEAQSIVADVVNEAGASVASMEESAGPSLGTVTFEGTVTGTGTPRRVSVAGIVTGDAGERAVCPPVTIDCTQYAPPGGTPAPG